MDGALAVTDPKASGLFLPMNEVLEIERHRIRTGQNKRPRPIMQALKPVGRKRAPGWGDWKDADGTMTTIMAKFASACSDLPGFSTKLAAVMRSHVAHRFRGRQIQVFPDPLTGIPVVRHVTEDPPPPVRQAPLPNFASACSDLPGFSTELVAIMRSHVAFRFPGRQIQVFADPLTGIPVIHGDLSTTAQAAEEPPAQVRRAHLQADDASTSAQAAEGPPAPVRRAPLQADDASTSAQAAEGLPAPVDCDLKPMGRQKIQANKPMGRKAPPFRFPGRQIQVFADPLTGIPVVHDDVSTTAQAAEGPPAPSTSAQVTEEPAPRASLRLVLSGANPAKCTFCRAAAGDCDQYIINIGATRVFNLAVFNLGVGADHRPTCHRAFADAMKAFNVNWPGVNMERRLDQFYDPSSLERRS